MHSAVITRLEQTVAARTKAELEFRIKRECTDVLDGELTAATVYY
jgi:hypothetical protein